jgi:5-methylcytosine-specific restriction enzyme B
MSNNEKISSDIRESYLKYKEEGRIEFITFHPAYSYEEFVEGITVDTREEGIACEHPSYLLKGGIFKNFCKHALAAALGIQKETAEEQTWRSIFDAYRKEKSLDFADAPKFVLIIDEINRGDMAKIFGELITLLEADKRIGEDNELIVRLPVSGDYFGVPPNLYIIATMNTADRSIALLDVALRRRFGFIEMNPDFNVLDEHINKNKDKLENGVYDLILKSVEAIKKINQKICADKTIGRDRQIGHSFLFKVFTNSDLLLVWKHEIFPLLEEYCYSDYKKINRLVFGLDSDTQWISEAEGVKDINNLSSMLEAIK